MAEEIKVREYDEVIAELYEKNNIESLLGFNETNIQEKLSVNSAKIYHFTELYQRAKNEYDGICEIRDKLMADKYNYYKTHSDVLLKQGEIERYYLLADKDIIKMNKVVRQQKAYVDFYDNVRKALEKQSWNMQTFLKSCTYGI